MASGQSGRTVKHIYPCGLRWHVGCEVSVFAERRGFTRRLQILEKFRCTRGPGFVYPEPLRPITHKY